MPLLRNHGYLVVAMACVTPLYFIWTWSDQIGQLGSDGPSYLLAAQRYSGLAGDTTVAIFTAALNHFPPLYPLLLAYLHATGDLHYIHAATTAFFMAALLVFYIWLRSQQIASWQAPLQILLIAALRESWLLGLTVQSEYLYLFWSLLALTCLSSYERHPRNHFLYLAALAIAAAALTRSIGVTLFAPLIVLAIGKRTAPRAIAGALLIASTPLLLWSMLHRPSVGYTESLLSHYADNPVAALNDQLSSGPSALRAGFEKTFSDTPELRFAIDALGAILLVTALRRTLMRKPDGVYATVYLLILLIWPYPDDSQRLIWPLVPVLVAQPLLLLANRRQTDASVRQLQGATAVLAAVVLFIELPQISTALERFRAVDGEASLTTRRMRSWYDADERKANRHVASEFLIINALRRIGEKIPADACVIAVRPELVTYFSRRLSAPPPLDSVPEPEFQRQLHAPRCRYVFMTTASYSSYPIPLHPLQHLPPGIKIIDYRELPPAAPGDGHVVCILAAFE